MISSDIYEARVKEGKILPVLVPFDIQVQQGMVFKFRL